MPPTYLAGSQIILFAIKVSTCRWTSLLVYWNASFYSCLTMWKNKQHSDNVPQHAVHVFASHGLMHQDIHSGRDWVKIHKTVLFLVNHGSCLLESAGIIFSVINILIFQVSSRTFHDFSIPKVIFHDFPDLENFYFKFHNFPDFSRICTNPDI